MMPPLTMMPPILLLPSIPPTRRILRLRWIPPMPTLPMPTLTPRTLPPQQPPNQPTHPTARRPRVLRVRRRTPLPLDLLLNKIRCQRPRRASDNLAHRAAPAAELAAEVAAGDGRDEALFARGAVALVLGIGGVGVLWLLVLVGAG